MPLARILLDHLMAHGARSALARASARCDVTADPARTAALTPARSAALTSTLALAACGGGSSGGGTASTPAPIVFVPAPTATPTPAPTPTPPPTPPVVSAPTPTPTPAPSPTPTPTPTSSPTPAPTPAASPSPTPAPTPSPTPTPPPSPAANAPTPTEQQASRFLVQASMGATRESISTVVSRGYAGWIDDQIAMPRAISHWDWLVAQGYGASANRASEAGFNSTVWRQMIVEPDQLRQRIGMALLNMLVVGIQDIDNSWRQFTAAAYVDVLLDNAFGNFRTILDAITTNMGMATYVTFLNNKRANSQNAAQPDENYARELMQLFTLGPVLLNIDGTVVGGGTPIETYTEADVSGLARVFTGLVPASKDVATPDRNRMPLVMNAAINESGAASFLGASVGGGGMAAIKVALDTIFAHANLPPFVCKQLIQRLVTSNPTPGYVARVASVFANNGAGVRGDMAAVVRAILLDDDARSDRAMASPTAGRLREPVLRLTAWARAFGVKSPSEVWAIGDTSSQGNRLGQSMGRAPSVFNFFRPNYAPPATAIARAGLVAPEFQITNEQSVIAYVNYMQVIVGDGAGDAVADYSQILTRAADSAALVDEVNLVLAAGQLGPATIATIRGAVDSVSLTLSNGAINRVGIAILLTLASPDFLAVR